MEPHVDAPPRKRRRAALSCENCRQKKLKCDRNEPCEACVKSRMEYCVYRDGKRLASMPAVISRKSSSTLYQHGVSNGSEAIPMQRESPYLADPSTFISSLPRYGASSGNLDTPISLDRYDRAAPDSLADGEGQDGLPLEQIARQKVAKYQKDGFGSLHPRTPGNIQGSFSKGRFYGGSHWISYLYKCPSVSTVFKCFSSEDVSDLSDLLVKCKVLTYKLKTLESTMPKPLQDHKDSLPECQVADRLVQAYMLSFETILPILDLSAFWNQYSRIWFDRSSASLQFLVQLKLVLSIGSVTSCETAVDRLTVCHWIHEADSWLSSPHNKCRMSLDGLRTRCLLLLARQVNGVDSRALGFDAGSTYQMAMQLGLHVDPSHLQEPAVSRDHMQLRRRLWATLMELELQATMDAGSIPLMRESDYDCMLPDGIVLDVPSPEILYNACADTPPIGNSRPSSVQILLAKSLPLRLEIARFVNDFRSGSRYQEALRLTAAFVLELRQAGMLIERHRKSGNALSNFQSEVFNLLMHRFVLALHYNFAIRARTDPTFYYSRKMCLESALAVLTPGSSPRDNEFFRLTLQGKGVYEDVYTQAFTFLCDEVCIGPADSIMPASDSVERKYLDIIRGIVQRTLARLHTGAANIKGYGLYACLLAYCEATLAGEDIQTRVRAANRQALETGHAALRLRYEKLVPEDGAAGDQALPTPAANTSAGDFREWFIWNEDFDPDADNWLEDLIGLTS